MDTVCDSLCSKESSQHKNETLHKSVLEDKNGLVLVLSEKIETIK